MSEKPSIYDEIRAERTRQDQQWGGPEHDDLHGVGFWLQLIQRESINASEGMLRSPGWLWASLVRTRLVKIAALAVAGIESIDRRAARQRLTGEGE